MDLQSRLVYTLQIMHCCWKYGKQGTLKIGWNLFYEVFSSPVCTSAFKEQKHLLEKRSTLEWNQVKNL